jgi:hypothetical protein
VSYKKSHSISLDSPSPSTIPYIVIMHKLVVSLSLFAIFSPSVFGDCTWPNGTDIGKHWWQLPSSIFNIYGLLNTNKEGQQEYPIHLNAPVLAILYVNNTGPVISQVQVDIDLAEWNPSNCKWNTIPTFGLL